MQHSIGHQFISSAAGKYHSLAVSTSGVVYSFGDGRKGQLGHGNMFTSTPYNPMKMTLRKGALGALQVRLRLLGTALPVGSCDCNGCVTAIYAFFIVGCDNNDSSCDSRHSGRMVV